MVTYRDVAGSGRPIHRVHAFRRKQMEPEENGRVQGDVGSDPAKMADAEKDRGRRRPRRQGDRPLPGGLYDSDQNWS